MITLDKVTKTYITRDQKVEAVQEYSGEIPGGEFVVVTGRSGAGKSTLLSLVGGLIRPDSGRVIVSGKDLWSMTDRERSRFRCESMGFVFQFASLIPTLTVVENVMLPTAFLPSGAGVERKRALELLDRVGLDTQADRMPWQLSGGQQKRVAVARALLHKPALLLADEPTADLDELTENEIVALFSELHKEGMTVLMATHNTELAKQATRHMILSGGRVSYAS